MSGRSLVEELIEFVSAHRSCGQLQGNVEVCVPNISLVWVICACGDVFEAFVGAEAVDPIALSPIGAATRYWAP
jgi:hypothetical protein